MIRVLILIFIIFYSCKDFIFFNLFVTIDESTFILYIIGIFSLILINTIIFSYITQTEFKLQTLLFPFIIISILLRFIIENLFVFLILFEIIIFPIFILIYNFSKGTDKISSVIFILFFNLSGSVPFIIFSRKFFDSTFFFSPFYFFGKEYFRSNLIFFSFLLIFLTKIPIIFFHFWLPKAHGRASGSCSMILARLVLKLGTFGILKFIRVFSKKSIIRRTNIFTLGVLRAFIFSIFIYRFFDLKHLVAISSILHISIIRPSCFFNRSFSNYIAILIIAAHGFVSFFLFYLVTTIYEGSQTRRTTRNKFEESSCKTNSIILYISVFLNLGVPPFINFIREMGFCRVIVNFSLIITGLFTISLLTNIFFTILICRSILFGKKLLKNQTKTFLVDLWSFKKIIRLLFISPLLIYSFSLKKNITLW